MLESFFTKAARKKTSLPELEDLFIRGKFFRYFLFRIRYFILAQLIFATLHWVEFKYFSMAFSAQFTVRLFGLSIGLSVISQFWWSALDRLREVLRAQKELGNEKLFQAHFTSWLQLANQLSLGLLSLGLAVFFYFYIRGKWEVTAPLLYCSVGLLNLIVELPLRTYHSKILAIQRLYRPFYFWLAQKLCGTLCLLIFFPLWGLWGVGLAALASSIINTGIQMYIIRRAWMESKWLRRASLCKNPGRAGGPIEVGVIIARGLSGVATELALLSFYFSMVFQNTLVAKSFLIAWPVLRFSIQWPRLFYFDLRKLQSPGVAVLTKILFRRLILWSPLIPLITSLLFLVFQMLNHRRVTVSTAAILPAILAASLFSVVQTLLFLKKSVRGILLAILLAGVISLLSLCHLSLDSDLEFFAGASIMLAAIGYFMIIRAEDFGDQSVYGYRVPHLEMRSNSKNLVRVKFDDRLLVSPRSDRHFWSAYEGGKNAWSFQNQDVLYVGGSDEDPHVEEIKNKFRGYIRKVEQWERSEQEEIPCNEGYELDFKKRFLQPHVCSHLRSSEIFCAAVQSLHQNKTQRVGKDFSARGLWREGGFGGVVLRARKPRRGLPNSSNHSVLAAGAT